MTRFEHLDFLQLVDILAETTARYTKALKENRNSDNHLCLKNEIHELIAWIDTKRIENDRVRPNNTITGKMPADDQS